MKKYATLFSTASKTKKVVSGVCMMITVGAIGILSNAPADAKLLNGHIEAIDVDNSSSDTTRGVAPNGSYVPEILTTGGAPVSHDNAPAAVPTAPAGNPQVMLKQAQPTLAYNRAPNVVQLKPPPNSFPVNFSGRWQCVTKVVDSAIESVAIGTELSSEVNFVEVQDGRVIAHWLQPGWTETQASAMAWSSREAQTDRTSYYFGEGMNGAWASRSRDHFMQVGTDRIECKSYVDQYMDGRYLGRYRTVSVMTRLGTVNTIAQGARKDK